MLVFRGVYDIYLHVVDVYGKLVDQYTLRPMDPIGKGLRSNMIQHEPYFNG